MKKLALFFLISSFLYCCALKDLDFEAIPESAALTEKIQEGIIVNTDEAFLGSSIKGVVITWKEPATISPELSGPFCFIYSGSSEELKKLSELRDHRVRLVYIYEDDGWMNFSDKRIYMPIARMMRVEDLKE